MNEILDVANEFSDQRQHYCLVLQWSSGELSILLSMIRRHVIEVYIFLIKKNFTFKFFFVI